MTKKQQLFFLGFFLLAALLIVAMLSKGNTDKPLKTSKTNALMSDSLDSNLQNDSIDRHFIYFNESVKLPFVLHLGNMRLQVDTLPGELDSLINRFLAENKNIQNLSYQTSENPLFTRSVEYTENGGSALMYFQRNAYLKIKNSKAKALELPVLFEGFFPTFEHIKRPTFKNVEHILIYGSDQAMCGGIGFVSILLIKKDGIVELRTRKIFYDDSDNLESEGMSKAERKKITTEYDTIEKIYLPVYQEEKLVYRGIDLEVPNFEKARSYYTRKIPDKLNTADIYISEKTVIRTKSNYDQYYQQDTVRVTDYFYRWDGNKSILVKTKRKR